MDRNSRISSAALTVVSLSLMGWLALGCGSSREAVWDTTASGAAQGATAAGMAQRTTLLEEATAAWEQRDDEAQLRTAIAKWSEAAQLQSRGRGDVDGAIARALLLGGLPHLFSRGCRGDVQTIA